MALATACALGVTAAATSMLGGSGSATGIAAGLLALASALTFIPCIARVSKEHWGVLVLFCGAGRGVAALAVAWVIGQQQMGIPPRPLFLGIAAGALFLLVAETALTISILSKIERQREALKAAASNATPDRA